MTAFKRFFLALLMSTGTAAAEDNHVTPRQTLMNMNNAMQALNYQGTVAFFRNGKLETMKYFHAARDGQEQERLLSLNSPLREVVRDADRVSCRFKDTQQIIVDHRPYEHSFLVDLPENFDELDDVYRFELAGEEDIAMLPSYIINIKPKDEFRYNRKVWVEKQRFLPLKVAVYDPLGATLEQMVFTEQEVKDRLVFVDVKLPDDAVSAQQHNQLQGLPPDQSAFIVTQLPAGFRKVFFTRKPVHHAGQPVDHLVLSDGFASVSVYMENKNPAMQAGLQSVGAVNSFSRILDNYLVTVMGEVPATTVKMIAENIELKGKKE